MFRFPKYSKSGNNIQNVLKRNARLGPFMVLRWKGQTPNAKLSGMLKWVEENRGNRFSDEQTDTLEAIIAGLLYTRLNL